MSWLFIILPHKAIYIFKIQVYFRKIVKCINLFVSSVLGMPSRPEDSAHVTAIYGDWVALNCDVNFPDGHVVPYVVQWWRKVIS